MENNLFDFIADQSFRKILERDFVELEKCWDNNALKSVLVLSGSIIEAVLVEYFKHNLPSGKSESDILKMHLYDLIVLAEENDLISKKSKDLSIVVKNYRNLIHPGREIRKSETIDADSANVAMSITRMVTKDIRKNYLEEYGYKAEDIINKLESDALSHSIFEKLVAKINNHEKARLLNLLTDYDLSFQPIDNLIEDVSIYIDLLKPLVKKELIIDQLEKLVQKVETGQKWEVMVLYKLYHNELNMLSDDKIETIIVYLLNALKQDMQKEEVIRSHYSNKLFTTLGKYVNTEEQKRLFGKLTKALVKNYNKDSSTTYFWVFDQISNSLDSERRENLMQFIEEKVPSHYSDDFLEDYDDGNYLPF